MSAHQFENPIDVCARHLIAVVLGEIYIQLSRVIPRTPVLVWKALRQHFMTFVSHEGHLFFIAPRRFAPTPILHVLRVLIALQHVTIISQTHVRGRWNLIAVSSLHVFIDVILALKHLPTVQRAPVKLGMSHRFLVGLVLVEQITRVAKRAAQIKRVSRAVGDGLKEFIQHRSCSSRSFSRARGGETARRTSRVGGFGHCA